MRNAVSAELRVMLGPKQAFAEMAAEPAPDRRWLAWRRPLFAVVLLTGGISLVTTGRLSVHIVGSAALYWSLLPLTAIVGLAAVHRSWPQSSVVDRFFVGYGPWLLYVTAFAAFGSSEAGGPGTPGSFLFWELTAAGVLVWSCWIDYRFFGSGWKLALHRAVSWPLFAAIFAGSWLWVETGGRLGL